MTWGDSSTFCRRRFRTKVTVKYHKSPLSTWRQAKWGLVKFVTSRLATTGILTPDTCMDGPYCTKTFGLSYWSRWWYVFWVVMLTVQKFIHNADVPKVPLLLGKLRVMLNVCYTKYMIPAEPWTLPPMVSLKNWRTFCQALSLLVLNISNLPKRTQTTLLGVVSSSIKKVGYSACSLFQKTNFVGFHWLWSENIA